MALKEAVLRMLVRIAKPGEMPLAYDYFSKNDAVLSKFVGNTLRIDRIDVQEVDTTSLSVEDGVITIKEATTPTAVANYGKIYTKSDNKLYVQTGDGVEHEIAFVP
jgi:hypothetical protein